jgi:hypothetical protein
MVSEAALSRHGARMMTISTFGHRPGFLRNRTYSMLESILLATIVIGANAEKVS